MQFLKTINMIEQENLIGLLMYINKIPNSE